MNHLCLDVSSLNDSCSRGCVGCQIPAANAGRLLLIGTEKDLQDQWKTKVQTPKLTPVCYGFASNEQRTFIFLKKN